MLVPPITIVLISLSLLFFISCKKSYLITLLYFSLIFSEASINAFITVLSPDEIISAILILFCFIEFAIKRRKIFFDKNFDRLILFCFLIFILSIISVFFAQGADVFDVSNLAFGSTKEDFFNDLKELKFSKALLTQNFFILFPAILMFFLKNEPEEQINKYINVYIYSVIFLSIWNIIAFAELTIKNSSFLLDLTHFLIDNEANHSQSLKQNSVIDRIVVRVGGFTGEPSRYAFVAIPAFGYVFNKFLISKDNSIKWFIFTFLILIGIGVSFSTSGFASLILLSFFIYYRNYNLKKIYPVLSLALSFILILFFINKELILFIGQYNFGKIFGGMLSSDIRLLSIYHSLNLFLQYPLIGVGIGSNGALSGIVTLLTSIGILGMFLFIFSIYPYFKNSLNKKECEDSISALAGFGIYNSVTGSLETLFHPIGIIFLISLVHRKKY